MDSSRVGLNPMGFHGTLDPVLFFIWGWGHVICFSSLGLLWYRILGVDVIMKNLEVDGHSTPKFLKLL